MTTLENDTLTFDFPEVAAQLRSLIESHFATLAATISLPSDRKALLRRFQDWQKQEIGWSPRRQNPLREKEIAEWAYSLSEADAQRTLDALRQDALRRDAVELEVSFQRTLRIPDDGRTYPLPAGLGNFPLRAVDDLPDTLPDSWRRRGGVMMPMYQSEALWIYFHSSYPFALKVAAGKIDAVSGGHWIDGLQDHPQNYLVVPEQPWLDGFAVGEGIIRQFVAMPLGAGYSVEEQLTGKADVGGMQLQTFPMRVDAYFEREVAPELPSSLDDILRRLFNTKWGVPFDRLFMADRGAPPIPCESAMGLGVGGQMLQETYADPHGIAVWDQTRTARCFVHLANSMTWRKITGANPPHPPFTAREYEEAGIPWFDYYRDDLRALKGSKQLATVKSVAQLGAEKNSHPLPDNDSIQPELVVQYGNTRRPIEIREFLGEP